MLLRVRCVAYLILSLVQTEPRCNSVSRDFVNYVFSRRRPFLYRNANQFREWRQELTLTVQGPPIVHASEGPTLITCVWVKCWRRGHSRRCISGRIGNKEGSPQGLSHLEERAWERRHARQAEEGQPRVNRPQVSASTSACSLENRVLPV